MMQAQWLILLGGLSSAATVAAQGILDGKLVTIPAATLPSAGGKLVTSLSRAEVSNLR